MVDRQTSTLEALNKSGTVGAITQLALSGHPEIDTDQPAVILPEGAKVESLEYLFDVPRHMRSTFRTERISDFCHYVDAEGRDDTVVFVAPDGTGAQAIIDYGNHESPEWGFHRAELKMQHSPEFAALKERCGRGLDQRGLVEFFEDWRDLIQPYQMAEDDPENASDLTIGQAIARIRKIDVKKLLDTGHEQGDFSARRSTMASVEAVSDGLRPPAGFRFTCQPFPDLQARDIDVRLSVRTTKDEPVLVMRIVGATALDRDLAEEIELDITERLDGKRVFIGSAKTAYE